MRFAINVPNFGAFFDPRTVADLARETEEAGWDGFFLWDHINFDHPLPMADPWIVLAVVAAATSRIRIGTMVTPLPRRRPWKVARETATLDHLSGGRVTLGVGLGNPANTEYEAFGEESDLRIRAARLDEAIEVLTRLWSGERQDFDGVYYQLNAVQFAPPPVQGRIPIWVATTWPNRGPLRRAARWDGVFALKGLEYGLNPAEVRTIAGEVTGLRSALGLDGPFDIVHGGQLPADPSAARDYLQPFADAGLTWWQAVEWDLDAVRSLIHRGPPRL